MKKPKTPIPPPPPLSPNSRMPMTGGMLNGDNQPVSIYAPAIRGPARSNRELIRQKPRY